MSYYVPFWLFVCLPALNHKMEEDNNRLKIGEYNTLTIDRSLEQGLYLTTGLQDVLLPKKFITPEMEIGKDIEVFVMVDSEDRPVATTLKPAGVLGDIIALEVVGVTGFGAFLTWGVDKDLFVPTQLMRRKVKEGDMCVVRVEIDKVTNRLIGNPRIDGTLEAAPLEASEEIAQEDLLDINQEVDLLVFSQSPIGFSCVVNNKYQGMLYQNEVFRNLYIGNKLKGYVRQVREDGKIDLSLRKQGFDGLEGQEYDIVQKLEKAEGFLPFNDNSDPEDIRANFQMSKKSFKKLIGVLYKKQIIEITHKGIKLASS